MKTDSVIAANRFGLGARPGDIESIGKNPKSWLLDQLSSPSRVSADIRDLPDTASVLLEVQDLRRERREMRDLADDEPAPDIVRRYGRTIRDHYLQQTHARYRFAATE